MNILEIVLCLTLLIVIAGMVHSLNGAMTKQLNIKEQQLITITKRYRNQWNTAQ